MPFQTNDSRDTNKRCNLGWRFCVAAFVIGWGIAAIFMFPGFFIVDLDGLPSFIGYLFLYGLMLGVVGVLTIAVLAAVQWLLDRIRDITKRCR